MNQRQIPGAAEHAVKVRAQLLLHALLRERHAVAQRIGVSPRVEDVEEVGRDARGLLGEIRVALALRRVADGGIFPDGHIALVVVFIRRPRGLHHAAPGVLAQQLADKRRNAAGGARLFKVLIGQHRIPPLSAFTSASANESTRM